MSGRNFARGCTLTLLGTLAPQVEFDSDKRLFFTAPAHEAGAGAVRVTNPDGLTTLLESAFEYRTAAPPAVTQLSPDRAWVSGGARLLVSGSDFIEGCTATIAGKDAPVKWKNGGLLEIMVPAGGDPAVVDLVVANPDGQTGKADFTYERVPTPPKLITVTPGRGPTHGTSPSSSPATTSTSRPSSASPRSAPPPRCSAGPRWKCWSRRASARAPWRSS